MGQVSKSVSGLPVRRPLPPPPKGIDVTCPDCGRPHHFSFGKGDEKDLIKNGWKRTARGWICPICVLKK